MTKEHLLSKTLYGVDIMNHLIRKEYPDFTMQVKGDDCGENPDPVFANGEIIRITVEKTYKPGSRLPERKAKYHYLNGTQFDGDAIALAKAYWHERGEDLDEQQLIDRLAAELHLNEPDYNPYDPHPARPVENVPQEQPERPQIPPAPKMSFFRRPIRNTKPCREASPEDIFKYLVSDYAKPATETLRTIADKKERSRFKAAGFDYITPGGIFRSRKESDLISASGYMVIDFDHITDVSGLTVRLANDDNFETVLAFRSPSGDGLKWIVALPEVRKKDDTPYTFEEFFIILSNYSRQRYGIEADPSGKDICRACFLPHDPEAFLNPLYIEDRYDYDITRFLR